MLRSPVARVVGAGQIARVVGLGSHVFISACAIARRTNTAVLSAAAELAIAEKKFGLIHSPARLRNALKTLRKRGSKLTQRIAWEVSSDARPCKRLRRKTHPEEL